MNGTNSPQGFNPFPVPPSKMLEHRVHNRSIANECIKKILNDIANGERDFKKLLLYAADTLDTATDGGGAYLERLEKAISISDEILGNQ